MKRKRISVLTSLLVLVTLLVWVFVSVANAAPVDFTIWTFEGETLVPSTDLTGNAAAVGGSGVANQSFPEGNGSTDSWSFTSWSTGARDPNDYFQFMVDLTDYGHIKLSFDERRSSTGIRDFEIWYSTDGTNFTQIPATVTNVPDDLNWRSHTFDFGAGTAIDLAIRGKSTVYFRIYGYNAEGAAGTWRIDNVTFNASTNPTAITLLSLTAASPLTAAPLVPGLVALGGLAAVAALGIGAGLVRRRRG